ncbi:hypothetical protein DFQ30_008371 [Apophysomyces sp. BC1015]|nr:hypothetical protein DFQ30_008371 [Apophysomyces sp. BC1015]
MLNPFANEFKPTVPSAEPSTKNRNKKKPAVKPAQSSPLQEGESSRQTYKSKQSGRSLRKPAKQKEPLSVNHIPRMNEPVKFITIEQEIDPLLIQPEHEKNTIIHGYEPYLAWIEQSLNAFGTVTVVGMGRAVVDVVSLTTILQHRGIGEHEDVETFSLSQGKKPTSCIQVTVSAFFIHLLMTVLPLSFSRSSNNNHEDTELLPIVNLDDYIATVDSRNVLSISSRSSEESSEESSLSSVMTKDDHFSEDENEVMHAQTEDEHQVQQRLFMAHTEEDITDLKKPTKTFGGKWTCFGFLMFLLIGWLIWTISVSRMNPATTVAEIENSRHIDFNDLYNDSFIPIYSPLSWVKNDPRDGIYTYRDPETEDILLESIEKKTTEIYVEAKNLVAKQNLETKENPY